MEIKILKADTDSISYIQQVAKDAWPSAFAEILTPKQIEYMMEMMYSTESLIKQIAELNHSFFICSIDDVPVGYMSIEHNCEGTYKTKIHKIYLLPSYQHKGVGFALYKRAVEEAKQKDNNIIYLNVNKNNHKAINFYKRVGFKPVKEETIDIGNGFVMDDYVLETEITQ